MSNEETEGRASARPCPGRDDVFEQVHTLGRTCGSTSLRSDALDRHHPIHLAPSEKHNRAIIVFVTVCTAKRRKNLASADVHEAIINAWKSADRWLVGRYVIMPDHVHFFASPNGIEAPSLEVWMRYWKSHVTRALREPSGSVWQRHHWDRQLRRAESYGEKWEYVCRNPVRHGLIGDAALWPYQCELNELRW